MTCYKHALGLQIILSNEKDILGARQELHTVCYVYTISRISHFFAFFENFICCDLGGIKGFRAVSLCIRLLQLFSVGFLRFFITILALIFFVAIVGSDIILAVVRTFITIFFFVHGSTVIVDFPAVVRDRIIHRRRVLESIFLGTFRQQRVNFSWR